MLGVKICFFKMNCQISFKKLQNHPKVVTLSASAGWTKVLTPSEAIHMKSRALSESARPFCVDKNAPELSRSPIDRYKLEKKSSDTKNTKLYKSIFFIDFENSNQFGHSRGSFDVSHVAASIGMHLACIACTQLELSSKHRSQHAYIETVFRA